MPGVSWCHTCEACRTAEELGCQRFKGGYHCTVCHPERYGSLGRFRPRLKTLNQRSRKHQQGAARKMHEQKLLVRQTVTKEVAKQVREAARARAAVRKACQEQLRRDACVANPHRPTWIDANRLAAERLRSSTQTPTKDPVLQNYNFCSPNRDDDATTREVRRQQSHAETAGELWVSVRAWRAFNTERFVESLGVVRPRCVREYKSQVVKAALEVWSSGYHACSNADDPVRRERGLERTHWRLQRSEVLAKRRWTPIVSRVNVAATPSHQVSGARQRVMQLRQHSRRLCARFTT